MNNLMGQLEAILPPPASPANADPEALRRNAQALKVTFPSDYVQYCVRYGSGSIDVGVYAWEVWSAARPTYPGIVARFSQIWGELRGALETADVPLGLYPEPGGLLPFGKTSDVWFAWKTVGDPEDWKVVVMWSYEHDSYQVFDMGFSEFLVNLLNRRITAAGFASEWAPADISFSQDVFYSP